VVIKVRKSRRDGMEEELIERPGLSAIPVATRLI
jgi:hypothetical protein